MRLYLKICGLIIPERETLLKKIDLIKHQVYPDLQVESKLKQFYPNDILINQIIPDDEKAVLLFKCLKSLNYTPSKNNNWDYHKFELLLDARYEWNHDRELTNKDGKLVK